MKFPPSPPPPPPPPTKKKKKKHQSSLSLGLKIHHLACAFDAKEVKLAVLNQMLAVYKLSSNNDVYICTNHRGCTKATYFKS